MGWALERRGGAVAMRGTQKAWTGGANEECAVGKANGTIFRFRHNLHARTDHRRYQSCEMPCRGLSRGGQGWGTCLPTKVCERCDYTLPSLEDCLPGRLPPCGVVHATPAPAQSWWRN